MLTKVIRALFLSCLTAAPALGAGFNLFIDPQFGTTGNTGSTAEIGFNFDEQAGADRLTLTITNTTAPSIGSQITGVGFEVPRTIIDPNDIDLLFFDGYFDVLTIDGTISPPWINAPGGYDAVLTGDGDILGGDPHGSPMAGETTTVILGLGDTGLSPSQLSAAFLGFYLGTADRFLIGRFQVVGSTDDSDKVSGAVPEPATLGLLALGGAALVIRRGRSSGNNRTHS